MTYQGIPGVNVTVVRKELGLPEGAKPETPAEEVNAREVTVVRLSDQSGPLHIESISDIIKKIPYDRGIIFDFSGVNAQQLVLPRITGVCEAHGISSFYAGVKPEQLSQGYLGDIEDTLIEDVDTGVETLLGDV